MATDTPVSEVPLSRCITFFDSVLPEKIQSVTDKILKLAQEDGEQKINLFLCSPGGVSKVAFGFYDLMRTLGIKLQTIAIGEVGSAAVVLFMAGKERLITPFTTIYFHEPTQEVTKPSRMEVPQTEELARDLKRIRETYINIITGNAPGLITKEDLDRMMSQETRLTALEAVDKGLAHRIAR